MLRYFKGVQQIRSSERLKDQEGKYLENSNEVEIDRYGDDNDI